VKVEFAPQTPGARHQPLRMVLDLGPSGEVLGIEVINLLLEVGKNALDTIGRTVPTTGDGVTYGYDEESDAFYLRLKSGKSLDQTSVDGVATCDAAGRIVGLDCNFRAG